MMTDEDLATAGERLYASLLVTELSVFEMGGLTAAIRTKTKWDDLGPRLKVAVFRIVANAQPPERVPAGASAASGEPAHAGTAASSDASPPLPTPATAPSAAPVTAAHGEPEPVAAVDDREPADEGEEASRAKP
jgi:hypothetical protein